MKIEKLLSANPSTEQAREAVTIFIKSVDALVELVKAARPFAKLLQEHQEHIKPATPIFAINGAEITKGDLVRLNEALANLGEDWKEGGE